MHSELIDCAIIKRERGGSWLRHSEGAQSVFGRTRAERILRRLGKGWEIIGAAELAPGQWFYVLDLSPAASKAEITAAHRRLAMENHPDRGGDDANMARINTARDEGLNQARR